MAWNLSNRQGRLMNYNEEFDKWARKNGIEDPWQKQIDIIAKKISIDENGSIRMRLPNKEEQEKEEELIKQQEEYHAQRKEWVINRAYIKRGYWEAEYVAKIENRELPGYMVPCGGGGEAQCNIFCKYFGGCNKWLE